MYGENENGFTGSGGLYDANGNNRFNLDSRKRDDESLATDF